MWLEFSFMGAANAVRKSFTFPDIMDFLLVRPER